MKLLFIEHQNRDNIEKHFSFLQKKGQSCEIVSFMCCDFDRTMNFLSVSSTAHCDFGGFRVSVRNNSCESKGDSDSSSQYRSE